MLRVVFACAMATCVSAPAAAQSSDLFPDEQRAFFRSDVAGTRPQPAFTAPGVRFGPYLALPRLMVSAAGDTNIFNDRRSRGDVYGVVEPGLVVVRDTGRDSDTLEASGRISRFARLQEQDSDEYRFVGTKLTSIAAGTFLIARIGYARAIEPRGAFGLTLPGGEPSTFRTLSGALGGSTERGRFRFDASASVAEQRFEPLATGLGPAISQSFRDIRLIEVTPRVTYAASPDFALFVTGTATIVHSLRPLACCRRDALGGLALVGVRGAIHDLVVGEVAVGWRGRDFDLARYRDYQGPAFYAKIDWYPTPLLSARVAARQDFENSGIPQVAGILARTFSLTAFYERQRNLTIQVTVSYAREKYREVAVNTGTAEVTLRGAYAFGRNADLALTTSYRDRSSSDRTLINSYHGARVSLSLTAAI